MRALAAPLGFIAGRALQALLVMLAILVIAFAVRTALGDPLREIMGEAVPEAEREKLEHQLGLDRPWPA
jgi:peptide/nickel transport system permease protein